LRCLWKCPIDTQLRGSGTEGKDLTADRDLGSISLFGAVGVDEVSQEEYNEKTGEELRQGKEST
jgi:hypothetical protein